MIFITVDTYTLVPIGVGTEIKLRMQSTIQLTIVAGLTSSTFIYLVIKDHAGYKYYAPDISKSQ